MIRTWGDLALPLFKEGWMDGKRVCVYGRERGGGRGERHREGANDVGASCCLFSWEEIV